MLLNEISNQILDKMENIEIEDLTENYYQELEELQYSFEDKVENCVKVIQHYENYIKNIDQEIDRLKKRKNSFENKVSWLKEYIMGNMNRLSCDKLITPRMTIRLQNGPYSCSIVNEEFIDSKYKELVMSTKIDRQAIIKDYKENNNAVPSGVDIKQNVYLRWY